MKVKTNRLFDSKSQTIEEPKRIKDVYGWLNKSIWTIKKSKMLAELVNDSYNRDVDPNKKLSELNPDVIKRCIELYASDCKTILDPFLNRGTTPIISAYMGKIGYANDIVPMYVDQVKKQVENLKNKGYNWANNININCGDARNIRDILKINFKLDMVDYIISSPPFWDIEPYESVNGQMSDIISYNDFLKEYKIVIEQLHEILRPECFCTYIVNDFRKEKEFYWFSGDTMNIFKSVGFKIHDIVINEIWSPFILRSGLAFENEKVNIKWHEYILTFRK